MLGKTPDIKAVMVANDTMAGAVVTDLKRQHLNGKVAVSGQDATAEGLQHIMDGDQCFTIYKPSTGEAGPAIKAIAQLVNGQAPDTKGVTITDPQTKKQVPAILATPTADHEGQRGRPDQRPVPPEEHRVHRQVRREVHRGRRELTSERQQLQDRGGRRTSSGGHPAIVPSAPPREGAPRPMSDQPILELRSVSRASAPSTSSRASTSTPPPDRSPHSSATTARASRRSSSASSGTYPIDSGDYLFEGRPVTVHSPRDASALGIEIVYQDLALCDNLDIVQNMFLGRERLSGLMLDESSMEQSAEETLKSLSVRTVKSVRQRVASLSGGQRQTVAIAKAVLWNSKVVVLDEPTAALGVAQTAQVLSLVRRLADRGLAVVLISHNMNDVLQVADSIAVLYLGQMAAQVRARRGQPAAAGRAHHHRPPRRSVGMTSLDDESTPSRQPTEADADPPGRTWPRSPPRCPSANTAGDYVRLYLQRVRGGEMGSLPAIAGLIVLVIFFSLIQPTFRGLYNFGNMLTEGSGPILLAMGLVFVLLLGEIDLSAGFAGGVCAAVMVRLMVGYDLPWPLTIPAALVTGLVIGLLIGFLRAKVRIPSFVVTLAFFLAFQGVALYIVNNGKGHHGDVRITDEVVLAFENSQMPKWAGWLLAVVMIVGYAAVKLSAQRARRKQGLLGEPTAGMAPRSAPLAVGALGVVYLLNQNRVHQHASRS